MSASERAEARHPHRDAAPVRWTITPVTKITLRDALADTDGALTLGPSHLAQALVEGLRRVTQEGLRRATAWVQHHNRPSGPIGGAADTSVEGVT